MRLDLMRRQNALPGVADCVVLLLPNTVNRRVDISCGDSPPDCSHSLFVARKPFTQEPAVRFKETTNQARQRTTGGEGYGVSCWLLQPPGSLAGRLGRFYNPFDYQLLPCPPYFVLVELSPCTNPVPFCRSQVPRAR